MCFSVGTSYNPKTAASTQHSTAAELKTWLFVHLPENVTTRRYNISTGFCFQWLVVETRLNGMWRKQQVVEIVCCFGSFFRFSHYRQREICLFAWIVSSVVGTRGICIYLPHAISSRQQKLYVPFYILNWNGNNAHLAQTNTVLVVVEHTYWYLQ